jgi:hypothetical protein
MAANGWQVMCEVALPMHLAGRGLGRLVSLPALMR